MKVLTAVKGFYFTGKKLDDETGLYYYGARYYDPKLGRFITADSIVQNPDGNPQTLNRYSYTGNNPVNRIDPTGHFFGFIAAIFTAIKAAATAVATYVAANAAVIATGAAVGGAVGGISAAAMGGNFWQGFGIGALSGGVFAGLAPGLSILSDGLARGITLGGAAGPLTQGAVVASNFGSAFLGGAAAGAAGGALAGADVGDTALFGGITAGAFSLARDTASFMRTKMIQQSRLDPRNSSGKSAGFKGDSFKLGGGRYDPSDPKGIPSPLGGHQGGVGKLFGTPYSPGSIPDFMVEMFAGPHDFLNSWAYDPLSGNIRNLNPVEKFIGTFTNPLNVGLATPIAIPSALPQAAGAAPAIIYGQSQGDIGQQISSEDSMRSSLVVD